MTLSTYAWLILALPLAGSLVVACGWRLLPGRTAGWIASGAIGGAFACAIAAAIALQGRGDEERQVASTLYRYVASSQAPTVDIGILIDPLSLLMALVVSGVSFLIHLYSVAYMDSDRGYARYFSYLNFFVFSMLLLVLAGNFALLIVGWALVGFASYAGAKAFIINVVGDVGMVLAAFLIFQKLGSLDYLTVFNRASEVFSPDSGAAVAICLLLLVGAFAKSAQLPLHTWLPDAMEGPTPVSALIHAATMVTAGVYLIARAHPLFEIGETAAAIAAIVGTATLVFAGTVALTQTDLKRVIAYSTISQIGYMILGVGAAAYAAGLFHLITHAFFKALLFMAAGSVIGAMAGRQSIDRMGGLRKAMPLTYWAFVIGALALSAFPAFSGYFSKDEVLAYVAARGQWWWILYVGGYLGALLTGLYAFRLVFRVFHGQPCKEAAELEQGHLAHAAIATNPVTDEPEDTDVGYPGPEHHIAERERSMAVPMAILAVLATVAGLLQIPHVTHVVERFLEPTFADSRYSSLEPSSGITTLGLILSALVALGGIALAARLYLRADRLPARLRQRFGRLYRFSLNKWYFDELFDRLLVRPISALGRFAAGTFERLVVQGLFVGSATTTVRAGAAVVRSAQSGLVRRYVALILAGTTVLLLYFLLKT